MTDFWLAGKGLGPVIIGFSSASAWITASALLLATGLFLLIGIGSIWIWVFPNIAGLIIIAAISGRIKNIPALTQPENHGDQIRSHDQGTCGPGHHSP